MSYLFTAPNPTLRLEKINHYEINILAVLKCTAWHYIC